MALVSEKRLQSTDFETRPDAVRWGDLLKFWFAAMPRLFRWLSYGSVVVVILLALVVGLLSQLLPLAERHPDRVAQWLSARTQLPVHFNQLTTQWTRRGPLLRLHGLRIGHAQAPEIEQAEILVAIYLGMLPRHSLTELRLRGLSMTARRDLDGTWSVLGLPHGGQGEDPLELLRRLGELQISRAQLQLDAPSLGITLTIPRVDLRLRVTGKRVDAGLQAWLNHAKNPVVAVLNLTQSTGNGQLYLAGLPLDLRTLAPVMQGLQLPIRSGQGRLQIWTRLQAKRVSAVTVDARLQALRLQATENDPLRVGARMQVQWPYLRLLARWTRDSAGWSLSVARGQVTNAQGVHRFDAISIRQGATWRVIAAQPIDVGWLVQCLVMNARFSQPISRWLFAAGPRIQVSQLDALGTSTALTRMSFQILELQLNPVNRGPGIAGLQGWVNADGQALTLTPNPSVQVQFDWPAGFGVRHTMQLQGQVVGWRDDTGWQIATPSLQLQSSDYTASVRGGLRLLPDGSHPHLSLAASLDQSANLPIATHFWVHSLMPKAAVNWLNMALVAGTIDHADGIVEGDLAHWPFTGLGSVFQVHGHLHDAVLRFARDWPVMDRVQADVTFAGNGFQAQGQGRLADVPIKSLQAGIADFANPRLQVQAQAQSDGNAMLQLLRRSGLQQTYHDTLDQVEVSGPLQADFSLDWWLKDAQTTPARHLGGHVQLEGVHVADQRYDVALNDVHGAVEYSDNGFRADALQGQLAQTQDPAILSLHVGNRVDVTDNVFEARLQAPIQARYLLSRVPQIDWLTRYVHGRSQWQVGVNINTKQTTQLTLESDLQGTTLDFPAPLDKSAEQRLATRIQASLPLTDGDMTASLGDRVTIWSRQSAQHTGVRVVFGHPPVAQTPLADGLVVLGQTDLLDALDWIGFAQHAMQPSQVAGRAPASDAGLALTQVNVTANRLELLGGVFDNTRLQLAPQTQGLLVQLNGPALAGELHVPAASNGTIDGHLQTFHWQPDRVPTNPTGPVPLAEPTAQAVADFDPSTIPSLAIDVADLQLGSVYFGHGQLLTHRLGDGLQLDHLLLQSPKQKLQLSGTWLGQGARARTQLVARVDSRNLGDLAKVAGYGSQLLGGEGNVTLNASWQGSPTEFRLPTLSGELHLNAFNGQLLEVEPGAGRVLGLLSVAQLPRRLMLDFRDLFLKGLAFNGLHGRILFGSGVANTTGITIESPAAHILIRGHADLTAETFDQMIDVNPRSGNLLTVVGAVAGGPVGAAVGAAANAVLSKPLGEIGARCYHVIGPWKNPRVEVVPRQTHQFPTPGSASGVIQP